MSTESEYQVRLKKLEKLTAQQQNPFFNYFYPRITIVKLQAFAHLDALTLQQKTTDFNCQIAGRIMQIRNFGNLIFAHLADHTGKIQLLIDKKRSPITVLEHFHN